MPQGTATKRVIAGRHYGGGHGRYYLARLCALGASRAGVSSMTQPANPPARPAAVDGSDTREPRQNGDPQLATGAQAHDDKEQQVAWLWAGPEAVHPVTRGSQWPTIGLSALAIVVSGLAVAAMVYFPAPGPVTREITTPPTGARPLARAATSTNAQPTAPPAPLDTTATSATAAEAPISPVSLVPVSATPEPQERLPTAGGATEHRSTSRHQPRLPCHLPHPRRRT